MHYSIVMHLKPQDFLVSLKIALQQRRREKSSYLQLASSCGMSASDAHAAVKRAHFSRLLLNHPPEWDIERVIGNFTANHAAILEFGIHGLKFVWPRKEGPASWGMPTGLSLVADELDMVQNGETASVWPTPDGTVKGASLEPWHPSLPEACRQDFDLYRLAAIIDVIRTGGARASDQAKKAFERLLSPSNIRRAAS